MCSRIVVAVPFIQETNGSRHYTISNGPFREGLEASIDDRFWPTTALCQWQLSTLNCLSCSREADLRGLAVRPEAVGHRITWSACSKIDSGIVIPRALAVLRLTASTY